MSNFKISGIVFVYEIFFSATFGASLLYSSVYGPSEAEKRAAASKYVTAQSATQKKEFEAFFAKMKKASDPTQQKVFDGMSACLSICY